MHTELLLGCGYRRNKVMYISPETKDWSNLTTLDINPACNPDVVWNLDKHPLPFSDNSFDEIHAIETLEHLGTQGDAEGFFKEFTDYWRILKPNGLLMATTPRWDNMWAWSDPSHRRIISEGSLVFLDQLEYAKQQGVTAMSDFRTQPHILYKADFERMHIQKDDTSLIFILKAHKPARTF